MSHSHSDILLATAFGPALLGDEGRCFYGDSLDGGVTTVGGIITANAGILSPLINAKIDVVSDDADDDLGDTGAEYVTLEGIDANNDEISEVVEMNGVGVQTTNATFKALNRAYVSQVGSSALNEGTITISITSGAAVGQIRPGMMEAGTPGFTVPNGYVAIPYAVNIEMATSAGQLDSDVWNVVACKLDANGLRQVIGGGTQRRSGGSITHLLTRRARVPAGESLIIAELFGTAKRIRAHLTFLLFDA